MKGERGITLLEVLAAVTIMAMVTGVAIMLFSSVMALWNNSAQKQADSFHTNFTMNTISRELADATEIYVASANELRYKTSPYAGAPRYGAFIYSASGHTLTLYDITGTSNIQATGTYAKRMTLADNVQSFAAKNAGGTALSTSPPAYLNHGELFIVSVTFENATITANGQKVTTNQTIDAKIKLLLLPAS
ncbi:hypothetical protein SD70_00690 [Gordoniibacillus kamchatkensis]|uniref:Prepilin-type N-terminal cleavage/methylation domain-containing protein n=1 Tax=Gordoniibacillus kamchatkensis TaxID=1590651 RepID=A0ABR5AN70_9BACL|nr:prepilin-type N-terminal cleavage/methylation domain-containing protein [Paenibacillus sp. VKM B-2647]KIL42459.1 hypothetical protein SD70_00690 [Paenibacillus sp. VKM B-2647]